MSFLIRHWKAEFLFALIVLPVFSYLILRARIENSWDDWAFGSAQTMLTARYWAEDGFIKNKFLFIPSGYHSGVGFLDQPEFRFLTDGTKAGELIGSRLYYTHYPSGYLIPYGLLAKFGASDRFWFRLVALGFSFASVVFLFGFIYLLGNRNSWIAFLAVLYYITSSTFLRFADSLHNTPVDDFFKWLILFLSAYVTFVVADLIHKRCFVFILWVLYFFLSVSSYDSTFFILFWLCALDYLASVKGLPDMAWYRRLFLKVNIKRYLFWALAPIAAFFLQIIQNTWYLGWNDMILDFFGAFAFRSGQIPGVFEHVTAGLGNIIVAFSTIGYMTDIRTRWVLPLLFVLLFLLYQNKDLRSRFGTYLAILFIAGFIFPFVLPGAGTYGYQGRQMAPALLLVFSIATVEAFRRLRMEFGKWKFAPVLLMVLAAFFWGAHSWGAIQYIKQWPNGTIVVEKIHAWKELGRITTKNTIILGIEGTVEVGFARFFEQFYADRLILRFDAKPKLLEYVKKIQNAASRADIVLLISPEDRSDIAIALHAQALQFTEDLLEDGRWMFRIKNQSLI